MALVKALVVLVFAFLVAFVFRSPTLYLRISHGVFREWSDIYPPARAEKISTLMNGMHHFTAVRTALDLKLFELLEAEPRSIMAVASAVDGDIRGVASLLEYLNSLGLVREKGGLYSLGGAAKAHLVKSAGADYVGASASLYAPPTFPSMAKPAQIMRTVLRGGADPSESHDGTAMKGGSNEHAFWAASADATVEASIAPANALATLLESQLGHARMNRANVLDLACGAGLYGFTLALRNDGVNVTVLDQSNVIAKTRKWALEFGVASRVKFVEGSVFEMEPPENAYDAIIVSHFLQNFDYATNVKILKTLAPSLKPNGLLVVHDYVRASGLYSPWTTSQATPLQQNFMLLLSTERGRTYTAEQLAAVFDDAGLFVIGMEEEYPLDSTFIYGARIPTEVKSEGSYHNQVG